MTIVGTVFATSCIVGAGSVTATGLARALRHRPGNVGAQVQATFASAGLCNKDKSGRMIPWRIDRIRMSRSGAGDGLLEGHELVMRYPVGRSVYDVMRHTEQIGEWLGCTVRAEHHHNRLHLHVYNVTTPVAVPFGQHLLTRIRGTWELPIGLGEEGWVYHDLAQTPHMLVGGATGSGKTNLLTMLVYALTQTHSAQEMRLHVVDMKMGLSFRWMEDSPYLEGFTNGKGSHVDRLVDALSVLEHLHDRMDVALRKLERWHVTSWQEAALQGQRIPHHILIVDEAAELSGDSKEAKKVQDAIWDTLASLCALGRAAGIHVILCTQRPQVDVVPGNVKANLDARIAFRLPDAASSVTILGTAGAEHIPPIQGRALYKTDRAVIVQTPKIDHASIRLRALTQRKFTRSLTNTWEGTP